MAWSGKTFHKHDKKLSAEESKKAAAQANEVLKSTGDEGEAIAVASKHAGKESMSKKMYKSGKND